MKYYIGFVFALSIIYVISKLQDKYNILNRFSKKQLNRTQSHKHLLRTALVSQYQNEVLKQETQSQKHEKKVKIKVIIMDDQAYWVKDNVFYTADMDEGDVNKNTTREVDTMTMNKVQLDKMMFIMDRLREGTFNDSGGTGN
jgi:hypothetical protein